MGWSTRLLAGLLLLALPTIAAHAEERAGRSANTVTDRESCLKMLAQNGVPVSAGSSSVAGAAYTPGVDAYGRPVAGADLGGGSAMDTSWLADSVTVVLSVDLAKKYGLGNQGASFGSDIPLGQVTLRQGVVYVNGQPLMTGDADALRESCLRLKSRSER